MALVRPEAAAIYVEIEIIVQKERRSTNLRRSRPADRLFSISFEADRCNPEHEALRRTRTRRGSTLGKVIPAGNQRWGQWSRVLPEVVSYLRTPHGSKDKGLGFGLSVNVSIVEAHGSRMWLSAQRLPEGAESSSDRLRASSASTSPRASGYSLAH